ncbi:MAG: dihydroorotate dehydrogenase [Acidobacteriota bacterium]|nr:dihydroorotate dehydrogenase [Blastocatellia bacterium]MDW8411073.1 dihydroorotate dehydrogenase [Acidobacteriota bacterium]
MVAWKSAAGEELLVTEICGIQFRNPVLAASGTFGYGLEFADLIDLNRLGGFCSKGLSIKPMKGNPPPRIVETHGGMLNAIGLQNVGVRAFVEEKLPQIRLYNLRVIANVFGFSTEEYVEVVKILNDAEGVDAYELNISCPNVKEGGIMIGNSPRASAQVTEAVKRASARPVIVKLSPNVTDIAVLARAVAEAGADAVSLINTLVGMSIDVYSRRPRLANLTGGLSGPAVKPIAVRMCYEVRKAIKLPILGIGGIATWMDALEFIFAGASAVQVGTANYYDPTCTMKIIDGLAAYCLEHNTRITDLVGAMYCH